MNPDGANAAKPNRFNLVWFRFDQIKSNTLNTPNQADGVIDATEENAINSLRVDVKVHTALCKCVCVRERARESECVCVCVRERERVCVCVCECVCV